MTPREQAALAVAHAEAAMPEVGDGDGFHAKVAAIAAALGVSTTLLQDEGTVAVWKFAPSQWVLLSHWRDGFRIEACYPGAMKRGEWRLSEHSLDAALRLALTWLADRDVFVEVRPV